jgi:DNA-binding FadR family transcriptional regulator
MSGVSSLDDQKCMYGWWHGMRFPPADCAIPHDWWAFQCRKESEGARKARGRNTEQPALVAAWYYADNSPEMARKKKKTAAALRPARKSLRLHGSIAREIGVAIVSGRYRPGHILDGEVEASSRRRVSRTAYREAVRILSAKGLVHSKPRIGTRVSALGQWHLLDPDVLMWAFSGEPASEVLHGLFELRSIVEPAAAALAATRRSQQHLDEMRRALDEMAKHTLHVEAGRIADQEFHASLLAATANPFVVSLTKGVTAAVNALTEFKQRIAPLRRDPVPDHLRVYDAIAAKDADRARTAMRELIRLAIMDMPVKHRPRPAAGIPDVRGAWLG